MIKIIAISIPAFLMLMPATIASHFNVTATERNIIIHPNETTKNIIFRITPEEIPLPVNIYYSSPFSVSLSNDFLNLLSSVEPTFNITVPKHTIEGNYKTNICVFAVNETECLDFNITVPRVSNFTVTKNLNISLNSSSEGYININLSNTGNTILNISSVSTTPFLKPSNITTYPGLNYTVPVFYSFPKEIGLKNYNITFTGDNVNKKTVLYINITDNEPPKLIDIKYPTEVKASKEFEIEIAATDNINISYINIEFNKNNTYNLTKNNNYYNISLSLTNISINSFILTIADTSGNKFSQKYPIEIKKLGGIKFFDYNPVEILYNFEYQKTIFVSENEIPVKLMLNSFSIKPDNAGYKMVVVSNSEEKEVKVGKIINLNNIKEISLRFSSPNVSEFNGNMLIIPPDYVGDNKTIKITGKVGNFNILNVINITIGDKTKECILDFAGDLHNSSYICQQRFPATYNFKDIGIDMTERDYNQIVEKEKIESKLWQSKYNSANLWRWVFISLWIFTIISVGILYLLKMRRGFFMPSYTGG